MVNQKWQQNHHSMRLVAVGIGDTIESADCCNLKFAQEIPDLSVQLLSYNIITIDKDNKLAALFCEIPKFIAFLF